MVSDGAGVVTFEPSSNYASQHQSDGLAVSWNLAVAATSYVLNQTNITSGALVSQSISSNILKYTWVTDSYSITINEVGNYSIDFSASVSILTGTGTLRVSVYVGGVDQKLETSIYLESGVTTMMSISLGGMITTLSGI